MKEQLIIVGMSTTGKNVFEFVKGYDLYDIVGFAVDEKYKDKDEFCGVPVYALEKLDGIVEKEKVKLFIAVLWNRLNADRRDLYERLKNEGYRFANLISPHAIIRGKILGDNCWLHDYVIIQPEACIEEDCQLMAFSLVGDCSSLGAHCFMGTKSTVAGKCVIGEQTFIGINCTIFDNTTVGEKCILGACTTVKRNVAAFTVVKTDINNVVQVQLNEEVIENKLLFKNNVR